MIKKYNEYIKESLLSKIEGPSIKEMEDSLRNKLINNVIDVVTYIKKCNEYNIDIDDVYIGILKNLKPFDEMTQSIQIDYLPGFIDAVNRGVKLNIKYSFNWESELGWSGAYVKPIEFAIMVDSEKIFDYITSEYPNEINNNDTFSYTVNTKKLKYIEKFLKLGLSKDDLNDYVKLELKSHPRKNKEIIDLFNKYNKANESLLNNLKGPSKE